MAYPHDPWQQPVAPYTGPQPPPLGAPIAAPHPPAPGAPWPPPYPPAPPRRSSNRLLIGILLVAVLGLAGLGVAPFVIMAKVSSDLQTTIADSTGRKTEQILAEELDVTFGTYAFTKDTEYSSPTGKLPVTFKNKGTARTTFTVQIEALDSSGNRIADDSVTVQNLGPGQSSTATAFAYSRDVDLTGATFNVAGVSRY